MSNDENFCAKGRENETNIKGIRDDITTIMDWIRRLEDKLDKTLETAMKRPGWVTTLVITVLTSTCVGLLLSLINVLKNGGG